MQNRYTGDKGDFSKLKLLRALQSAGFPAAVIDAIDIERAGGEELCRMAERMGVDLSRFVVGTR